MPPLVSILIPAYNAQSYLAEAIESALAQTWPSIELIVVDDGSTDGSLAVARSFESDHVKVVAAPHAGSTATRNRALAESQGDFIQYLDADDVLAPNKVQEQVARLSTDGNEQCVAIGPCGRFRRAISDATFLDEPVARDMDPVEWLTCSWLGGGMMQTAGWLVPRVVADSAGTWNEELPSNPNDDGEYFCRVVLASSGVRFCPTATFYYRTNVAGSLSSRASYLASQSLLRSLELNRDHVLQRENSRQVRRACAANFQRFVYQTYPEALDLVDQAERDLRALGGSDLKPTGSRAFQLIASTCGWKLAARLRRRVQVWRNRAVRNAAQTLGAQRPSPAP
jgi:glycosyltransferase involved in cell wall biosynthesis